jgi:hypothetical protein
MRSGLEHKLGFNTDIYLPSKANPSLNWTDAGKTMVDGGVEYLARS